MELGQYQYNFLSQILSNELLEYNYLYIHVKMSKWNQDFQFFYDKMHFSLPLMPHIQMKLNLYCFTSFIVFISQTLDPLYRLLLKIELLAPFYSYFEVKIFINFILRFLLNQIMDLKLSLIQLYLKIRNLDQSSSFLLIYENEGKPKLLPNLQAQDY